MSSQPGCELPSRRSWHGWKKGGSSWIFAPYFPGRTSSLPRCSPASARNHLPGTERCLTTLYTIGHSTRTLDELLEALHAHSIKALVDIRAFPMSRRLPHFNRENLEKALPSAGIQY